LAAKWNKNRRSFAYKLVQPLSIFLFGPKRPEWIDVYHGEELAYIFALPLKDKSRNYTVEDREMSRDMIDIWTDFAKTG
jgi:carboxylesterase type B